MHGVARVLLLALFALAAGCGDDDAERDPDMKAGAAKRGDAAVDASRETEPVTDAGTAPGSKAPIVLVGEVADTDIRVGAVLAAGRMRLFFCGGASSYATATQWVQAEVADDASVAFENDVLALHGALDGDALDGELTRSGDAALRFSAERVRAGTLAGLYEAEAGCGRVGLIVAQRSESDPPVAQGACVGAGHAPEQVNPILPLALDQNGTLAVEVVREDGVESARVHAAAPPMSAR
jgi:hypothetical protein